MSTGITVAVHASTPSAANATATQSPTSFRFALLDVVPRDGRKEQVEHLQFLKRMVQQVDANNIRTPLAKLFFEVLEYMWVVSSHATRHRGTNARLVSENEISVERNLAAVAPTATATVS
jgi:hypothetical protein